MTLLEVLIKVEQHAMFIPMRAYCAKAHIIIIAYPCFCMRIELGCTLPAEWGQGAIPNS